MATVVFDNGNSTGIWSDNLNWVGDALPGPADVADIDQDCTMDMSDIVAQLDVASTKTLTIQATYGLTGMTASMLGAGSIVTGAGCTISFDSASDIGNGTVNITCVGTTGSHCTITNAGAGSFFNNSAVSFSCEYTDFPKVYRLWSGANGGIFRFDHCNIDGDGDANSLFGPQKACSVIFTNNTVDNFKQSSYGAFAMGQTGTGTPVIHFFENNNFGSGTANSVDISVVDSAVSAGICLRGRNIKLNSATPIGWGTSANPSDRVMIDNYGFDGTTGTRGVWLIDSPFWTAQRSTTNPYTAETYCGLITPKSGCGGNAAKNADLEFWIPIQTGDDITVTTHGRRNGLSDDCADLILDEEQAWFTTDTDTPVLTNNNTYYEFAVAGTAAAGTAEKGSVRLILRVKEYVASETFQWGGVTVTVTHADTSTTVYTIPMG